MQGRPVEVPGVPDEIDVGEVLLEARAIRKSFGGVQALNEVSFELRAGEVHALMGENGAGKSTLMNVLSGQFPPDGGEICLMGERVSFRSPHEAMERGVAMIHQELMTVPEMTVAENLLLGREPRGRFPGTIDRAAMAREAKRLLDLLGVDLPVEAKMRELSVAGMQTVEIARALGSEARVVIMDEPTAAISEREVRALFRAIQTLKKRGVGVVYITHKMDEVFQIADRITVMRDGELVATRQASDLDDERLISLMVGRELKMAKAAHRELADEPILELRGLSREGAFDDVDLVLRRGEVLGMAGLMGAGRSEVASAVFGLVPADGGEIRVKGEPVRIRKVADAIRLGIGMVTEDRKGYGIVPEMSVGQNATLSALKACCAGPVIVAGRERAMAGEAVERFGVRSSGVGQKVGELSGGNQQKVVIARTMLTEPEIVILDEPTRGIDIGAKSEVYEIIRGLAGRGMSVMLVSSELPELLALSDRIVVMREGKVSAELVTAETHQEEILSYAMPE
ncbi:sugar ABC transporter ATP-binding protein [Haloferula sp.]|uniref:sugar ABC transporter ATP-binding protein n=1 Tax=Haloferula sp. TaxID=2497595 RepID=UPI003C7725AE